MSIAVMLTYDNISDLEYISSCVQNAADNSEQNLSAVKLINGAIDILKGKYDSVPE